MNAPTSWLAACLIGICVTPTVSAAEPPAPDWGRLAVVPHREGQYRVTITRRPAGESLPLPAGFPSILRAWQDLPAGNRPLALEYNAAGELRLIAPAADGNEPTLVLETAAEAPQTPDGRRLLLPGQAQLTAPATLEKAAGHERITHWAQSTEPVTWKFDATRWGMYRLFVTVASQAPAAIEVDVALADTSLQARLPATGSGQRYATTDVGRIYVAKAGPQTLTLRVREKTEAHVSLAAVILVPTCEGNPPMQAADGTITLHGQDATVEGTVLRYEPQPKKLTLGYWVRPTDAASWQFSVKEPGEFDVEVLQGCGAGQGGSTVLAAVGGQELRFEVEDTGHFQNFKPRTIGRVKLSAAGTYTLRVGPEKIARQAALDLRQVRLTPVK